MHWERLYKSAIKTEDYWTGKTVTAEDFLDKRSFQLGRITFWQRNMIICLFGEVIDEQCWLSFSKNHWNTTCLSNQVSTLGRGADRCWRADWEGPKSKVTMCSPLPVFCCWFSRADTHESLITNDNIDVNRTVWTRATSDFILVLSLYNRNTPSNKQTLISGHSCRNSQAGYLTRKQTESFTRFLLHWAWKASGNRLLVGKINTCRRCSFLPPPVNYISFSFRPLQK